MTRNHSIKRFLSGTVGAVMFLSALPAIAANAAIGTTVLTYEDYEVSYAVTDEWNGGQNVLITVTNLGDESLYNWAFQYDAGGSIEGLYNAVVFENEDTDYIVKNNGWNFELAPQRSVSFGYTMRGEDLSVPTDFELRSERVDVTEGYDVEIAYDDVWQDGMRGRIIVTNTTEQPMEGWTLGFDTNFQVEYVWNGRAIDTDENHYVIASEAWTQYLAPGQSKSIGFVGSFDEGTDPAFSDYEFSHVRIKGLHENDGPIIDIDMDTDNIDLGYIEQLIGAGLVTVNFDENSMTRAINGKFTNKTANDAAEAAHILNCAHTLFGSHFSVNADDLTVQSDGDETYYRCTALINGVPVEGSQVILVARDGEVTGLYSTYNKFADNLSTTPSVTAESAAAIASEAAFADLFEKYPMEVASVAAEAGITKAEAKALLEESFDVVPTLVIDTTEKTMPVLAWAVQIVNNYDSYEDEDIIDYDDVYDYAKYIFEFIDYRYYVNAGGSDAGTVYRKVDFNAYADTGWESELGYGDDLLGVNRTFNVQRNTDTNKFRMLDSVRNIETYNTVFSSNATEYPEGSGQYVHLPKNYTKAMIVSSDTEIFNNAKAVSAHTSMSKVYDYYLNTLGRDSYDNHHGVIRACIGYRPAQEIVRDNAGWDGIRFLYMDGEHESAVDVAGHEFTHAVVGSIITGGGLHGGESGALNEALADIMGSFAEGKARDNIGRWTINEDAGEHRTIRNMKAPQSQSPAYPNHYKQMKDPAMLERAAIDNGGVHLFSTIFSHAAYLMIMEDSRTASITDAQWARLFYKAIGRLSSGAKFLDGRYAVVGAATSMNFTADQIAAIEKAFDKVGIKPQESVRIVLNWGATPSDLDSHLTGPAVNGEGRFHTYYSAKNYYIDGSYYANYLNFAAELDYDDTDSYGPEITTIHELTPGNYYFYIHDYTNRDAEDSTELSTSGVSVNVYKGSTNELYKLEDGSNASFTVSSTHTATLWKVCKISIDDEGNVTVSKVNSFSNHSDPGSVGA